MSKSPFAHAFEQRGKSEAVGSQRVFDFRGNLRVDLAFDEAFALKLAELGSQDFLRGVWNQLVEFAKPPNASA